jgi:hypothetical protein
MHATAASVLPCMAVRDVGSARAQLIHIARLLKEIGMMRKGHDLSPGISSKNE